ncbi:7-aminocholesterol resistance protein RTA1 [Auriculariales sp. MPI-PUGE-AT-0066]|nr:7-aminocholesterol resistance protein RTA1 [Auriculariales sp. MPI-PUGE-AT-0066]
MTEQKFADFKFYHYDPSGAAAIIIAFLFGLSTIINIYQMVRTRTWYLIPFIIGGIVSFTSIELTLKRVIFVVKGEHLSPIRMRWLTKFFVGGDCLSLLLQGSGGGLMATRDVDNIDLEQKVILVGLVVQIIFFGLFVVTSVVFHLRTRSTPTHLSDRPDLPWRKHIFALYFMSILIFIRSVFEYAQGNTGYLLSHEIFLYIFDSLLMILVVFTMNLIHPSELDALAHGGLVSRKCGIRYERIAPIEDKEAGSSAELASMRPTHRYA